MPGASDSLFSLELVVEKLYIPHIVCRFPAVAFRLLDFPTLVIEHVEQNLADTIRKKISRDPYYHLPDQFIDLKDKHGNFMIKKGKSCLFKIPVETLKLHLSNTPLYVMVIDNYPETPKLLGSSTVPLNGLMNAVCADIAKKGESCPSVQGDKGLFKLYSLMGKEIGYFVLGFRLLCLGPSLIPHLPASALMKRSVRQQKQEEKSKRIDAVVDAARSITEETQTALAPLMQTTREMGSMTEAEMKDVLLQTVQTEEKAIHVVLSEPEPVAKQNLTATATQTERQQRRTGARVQPQQFLQMKEEEMDDSEGIVMTNIVCPPPLLYNSEFQPRVGMARPKPADLFTTEEDDLTLESLSEEEDEKPRTTSPSPRAPPPPPLAPSGPGGDARQGRQPISAAGVRSSASQQAQQDFFLTTVVKDKPRKAASGPSIPNNTVFPILTALLAELTRMQHPQLQVGGSHPEHPSPFISQVAQVVSKTASPARGARREGTAPPPVSSKQAAEEGKENSQAQQERLDESFFDQYGFKHRRSHRHCAHPNRGVPPNKSWIRRVPEGGVRPSKLTYGLTHTQKLRLARSNPAWLEVKEKEEEKLKHQRLRSKQAIGHDTEDFNATNFSDTLTEVRRLAEKELNRKGDQTLDSFHGLSSSMLEQGFRGKGRERKRGGAKQAKSPSRKSPPRPKPSSPPQRRRQLMGTQVIRREQQEAASDGEGKKVKPPSIDPRIKNISSPDMKPQGTYDTDDLPSANSDILDSRSQRSIEVHVPSAQIEDDSDGTFELQDEEEQRDVVPIDLKKTRTLNRFPGFGAGNDSFPESIDGRGEPNTTHYESDFQPLESTRVSKTLPSDIDDSRQFQSTDDYDTKQFHSTEEPELLGLMTDEDDRSDVIDSGRRFRGSPLRASVGSLKFPIPNPVASENSPVPATRRSTAKLDLSKLTPRGTEKMTPRGTEKFTPRDRETPLSSPGSSVHPTPRPRRPLTRGSIHTDSVSSYMPSDSENPLVSLSSDGNYSDDFHVNESAESITDVSSSPELPRLIPSTKLGFTIA